MKLKFDKKIIFGILIGIISVSTITVGAVAICNAKNVEFNPSDKSWDVDTIEDALNELYSESCSTSTSCTGNVAEPNLGDDGKLIPVTLKSDGETTTITYANTSDDWYNYCDAKWANAVILVDEPSKEYSVGSEILEEDIESYFVWIPKYKYKLWNTGTASKNKHSIDIVFSTANTTDVEGVSCVTPMTSGNVGNCNNGEYMTHSAFISMDVDGFWVGKFETGYKGATSTSGAQVSSSDSTKIVVKPNVYSWRNNTVSNMFISAYKYEESLNSHMMKNTEWGAVAYLSHSKYGINTEININNNSAYLTGYSALPSTNQQTYPGTSGNGATYNSLYNTSIGYLASTTGNITGIYDMSGGAHEYMASYMSGKPGSSGFTATTIANYDSKYFDVYSTSSTVTGYSYMILGDATGEMGPFKSYQDGDGSARYHNSWYADYSDFVDSSSPWFGRGGFCDYGVLAGQFDFSRRTGGVGAGIGSRLVLAP